MSLSHVKNGQPCMVDVSGKMPSMRYAVARSLVRLPHDVSEQLKSGAFVTAKGPVLATAIIAGTMAAKNTAMLIPFCHPLLLDDITLRIDEHEPHVLAVVCSVKTTGKTGVEMEALVGASTAALTIYDMCKALSHDIVIEQTRLVEKSGGKHDVAPQS